jgi:hypothetical protein
MVITFHSTLQNHWRRSNAVIAYNLRQPVSGCSVKCAAALMIEPGAWHSEGKCPSLPPLITALQTGSSSPCQHPGGVSCQTLAFRNRRIWINSPWIYNSWAINAIQDVYWVEVSKTRSRSMDSTAVHSHKTVLYCSGRWGVDCRLVVVMGWDCRLSTAALGLLYCPRVTAMWTSD